LRRSGISSKAFACPEDHRKDHQVDLVDEVVLDQLLDEPVAARHLHLAVELLLELAHLGRRVAAIEEGGVVPPRFLERCRDDELGIELNLLANSPSRCGQAPAKLS
jgi:hypothetical protein